MPNGKTGSDWLRGQVDALVALGDDPREAEDYLQDVVARVPPWSDPADWVPRATESRAFATVSPTDRFLARVDWYAADWVPPRYKRLLDSRPALAELAEYDPNQPRAPKGQSDGGQWVSAGAGAVTAGLTDSDVDEVCEGLHNTIDV